MSKNVEVCFMISSSKISQLRKTLGVNLTDSNLCINAIDIVLNNSLVIF